MYKVALFKSWRHPRKGPVPLFYSVDSDIRIWGVVLGYAYFSEDCFFVTTSMKI